MKQAILILISLVGLSSQANTFVCQSEDNGKVLQILLTSDSINPHKVEITGAWGAMEGSYFLQVYPAGTRLTGYYDLQISAQNPVFRPTKIYNEVTLNLSGKRMKWFGNGVVKTRNVNGNLIKQNEILLNCNVK